MSGKAYGASVNMQSDSFHSPLSVDVTYNDIHIAMYLIGNGADINSMTNGISLIDLALCRGYSDIASVLSDVASVLYNKLDSINAQKELFKICNTGQGTQKQVDALLRAGASVNATDDFGGTPLIIATRNNHQHWVKWLRQANANIFAKDKKSFTAMQYAVVSGNIDMVQLLLQNSGDKSSEDVKNYLGIARSLCITQKSNTSVANMKVLLEHESCIGYKRDITLKLLKNSIIAE